MALETFWNTSATNDELEGDAPMVSIVIPAYNAERTLGGVITGCLNQDYPKEKMEIIVIDDGSTDHTGEVANKYPVRYIYQENGGPAKARNAGFRLARGEIICFIDSDCIPPPNWLSRLTENFTGEEVGGCGGSYDIINKESLVASCIQQDILYRHDRIPRECLFLGSYNAAFRKKVLEESGGFNEEYTIASGEDNDLSYKIIKKGYKLIFDKENKVGHRHPETLRKFFKQQFWRAFWRMKLYRSHPDMVKGDNYSNLADYIQPPLFLFIVILLPFVKIHPARIWLLILTISGLALQLPIAFSAIKRTRENRHLAIIPLNFLRGFAWAGGMFAGIFTFFLRVPLRYGKKS